MAGLAMMLLTACGMQTPEAGLPIVTDTSEATTTPQTRATPAVDTKATVAAMSAQVTLSFPTAEPTPTRETDRGYSTIDRPDDDTEHYQIHFIYAIPSDGVDRLRDVNGEIERSANAANYWLGQKTGGPKLRYDTYEGKLDITFLQLPYAAEEISPRRFNQLLTDAGFHEDNKAYVVYYDGLIELNSGESICGLAHAATGTLFLQAYAPEGGYITCPRPTRTENYADHLEITLIHEVFHILGAVPLCAPNDDGEGHVMDSTYDLMAPGFYFDVAPELTVLDRNNDDYFDHGNSYCLDVANSVFMDPTRVNAEEPPGWSYR